MLDITDPGEITRFAAQGPCVQVTVDTAKGSTPRVAGTVMLVSELSKLGTIGGGHLEYMAIDAARQMLTLGEVDRTMDIPLGPDIGQCCGGHVTLLLSSMTEQEAADLASATKRAQQQQPTVYLFGAGHVGRALAQALLPLPLNALLIDSRAEELALVDPAINQDLTPLPETHIRAARPGSAFVILTHDHALDFLLTREALERTDAAYVGMIGSKSKRATFANWLKKETGSQAHLNQLTMPIGVSNLADKRPTVIAAMVAAEVMQAVGTYQTTSVPA